MSLRIALLLQRKNYSLVKRMPWLQMRSLQTKQDTEEKEDTPIKYSTSKANQWKAKHSSRGEDYLDTPRIQPTVIAFSLAAFLIYFGILREENDLDDWMRELEVLIPLQLEEAQLRTQIENGKRQSQDVSFYVNRLEVIQKKKEGFIDKPER